MVEFKTLKDLPNESRYYSKGEIKLDAVLISDLRKEAIKHIRHLRELVHENTNADVTLAQKNMNTFGLIRQEDWIINFFNIMEEELKDG